MAYTIQEEKFLDGGTLRTLSSSNVSKANYDPDRNLLIITYKSGDVWAYVVSEEEAVDFYHAPSKGTWIWDHVRVRGEGNKHKHQVPAHPF